MIQQQLAMQKSMEKSTMENRKNIKRIVLILYHNALLQVVKA